MELGLTRHLKCNIVPCAVVAGLRAGVIENHFNIIKQYINTAAKTPSGKSLNAITLKIRRRQQVPGKNMITLTNILNETSRAVLKVIQGPLPGFSGKSWRMQLMLDPFFPAWGLVPRSTAKSEEKTGPEPE